MLTEERATDASMHAALPESSARQSGIVHYTFTTVPHERTKDMHTPEGHILPRDSPLYYNEWARNI
jgi:hypothetical protein